MAAADNLGLQFTQRKRKRQGISSTVISARQDGRTLGAARLTEGDTFLDSVEVRPEARGKGIGHALVGQVTGRFGNKPLRLQASPFGKVRGPERPELMEFYGKHGFEPDEPVGFPANPPSGNMIRRPR